VEVQQVQVAAHDLLTHPHLGHNLRPGAMRMYSNAEIFGSLYPWNNMIASEFCRERSKSLRRYETLWNGLERFGTVWKVHGVYVSKYLSFVLDR
jgi:hypothetical protein